MSTETNDPADPAFEQQVKQTVAETFGAAASGYETIGPAFFARFGARLVELADLRPGMRVLDVGCGTGAALVPAARAVGPDGHVLGIDLAAPMVERARANVAAHGLQNVDVRSGDAEVPGVGPGDRDRVIAAQVLFFLPNLGRALRAYRHILRPGGVLAASSWGAEDPRWSGVYRSLFASIPEGGAPTLTPNGEMFKTDESIAAALAEAGFSDIRTVTEVEQVTYDNADQWISWSRTNALRAYWEAVPREARAAARVAAAEALAELAEPDGRIRQAVTVRYTLATRA